MKLMLFEPSGHMDGARAHEAHDVESSYRLAVSKWTDLLNSNVHGDESHEQQDEASMWLFVNSVY